MTRHREGEAPAEPRRFSRLLLSTILPARLGWNLALPSTFDESKTQKTHGRLHKQFVFVR